MESSVWTTSSLWPCHKERYYYYRGIVPPGCLESVDPVVTSGIDPVHTHQVKEFGLIPCFFE